MKAPGRDITCGDGFRFGFGFAFGTAFAAIFIAVMLAIVGVAAPSVLAVLAERLNSSAAASHR